MEDLRELLKNGAAVVDVRTKGEFSSGHVKGSINIPLDQLSGKAKKLMRYPHIILCCRSGSRSGMALRQLRSMGFKNLSNGGSWQNVKRFTN